MTTYDQFKSLLKNHNYAIAAEFAEREALQNPNKSAFWFNQQAIVLIRAGKFKAAIELSEKALSIEPENPYPLISRSDALLKSGDAVRALTGYEEVAHYTKLADRARKGILDCLHLLKEWNKILDYTAQWDLPCSEIYPFRIQALTELKRTDEAYLLCNKWLQVSADNRAALWLLLDIEIARDGLETVRLKYERLAKIPSKPPIYGEIYATLCKRSGKMDKAIGQYQKLEAKTQNPTILRKKAFALAKFGQELEAIPLLEELMRTSPADFYLNSSYTGACKRSNNLERAWKFYHELLSLFPDEVTLLGRMKKIQKKLEEGANCSKKPLLPDSRNE